jgi:hypothetical protein
MPTTYKKGFSTAKRSGVPTKRVTDPMNPMVSYWVDAYGKRTKAPSGSSGSVSSGSLGVGSGSALTRTSVASPNRSTSSRVQGVKAGLRAGAQAMSPVDLDVLTGKRSPSAMDAALLAASLVPVPGLKQIGKVAATGGKIAGKAAKSAGRTGKPLPEPKPDDFPSKQAYKNAHTKWQRDNMTPRERARDDAMRARREAAGVRNGDPARVTESTFKKPTTEAEKRLQGKAERDLRAEGASRVSPGTSTESLMRPSNIGGGSTGARAVTGRSQRYTPAELEADRAKNAAEAANLRALSEADKKRLKAQGLKKSRGEQAPMGPQTEAQAASKFTKSKPNRKRFKSDESYQKAVAKWNKARDEYKAENPTPQSPYREGGAARLPKRPANVESGRKATGGSPGRSPKGDVPVQRKFPEEPGPSGAGKRQGTGSPDNYSTGEARGASETNFPRKPDVLSPRTMMNVSPILRKPLPSDGALAKAAAAAGSKAAGKKIRTPKKATEAATEAKVTKPRKPSSKKAATPAEKTEPTAPKAPAAKKETKPKDSTPETKTPPAPKKPRTSKKAAAQPEQAKPGVSTPMSAKPVPKGPIALGMARKGPFAMRSPRAIEGRQSSREPIDIVARPVQTKPGVSTPMGAKPTQKGPFASGSPRAIEGKKPAKPRGNVGKYGPNKPFAQGMGPEGGKQVAKKLGRSVTTTAAVGAAAGGAMALSKSDAGKGKPDAKTGTGTSGKAANAKAFEDSSRKQSANTRTREGIVDNKGRLISREEFNQRSAFRSKFGLDDMTEAQREAWKKKNPDKWKAEVRRREEYRSTAGKKRFGKKALRITDKAKTRRSA